MSTLITLANPIFRETWKSYLKCPANTTFEFKSHDASIQHRAAIEESRRDKQQDKRKQVAEDKLQS